MINDIKPKPPIQQQRRSTVKYADMVADGRDVELAPVMGEIIFEAGQLVGKYTDTYKKKWRSDAQSSLDVVREVSTAALANNGSPEFSELNKVTFDGFREFQGKYARRISESGLLDARTAGEMVADIVHNEILSKEAEIASLNRPKR